MTTTILTFVFFLFIIFAIIAIAAVSLAEPEPMYRVHWRHGNGREGQSDPLPPEVAIEKDARLADVFGDSDVWIEEV